MSLEYDGISIVLVLKRGLNAYVNLGGVSKIQKEIKKTR